MPKDQNISIVFGRKLIKLMMAFPWRESSRENNCSEVDGGNKFRALITKPTKQQTNIGSPLPSKYEEHPKNENSDQKEAVTQ